MATPCVEYPDPGDVGFALITMGMIDLLEEMNLSPNDQLLVLSKVFGETSGLLGAPDLSRSGHPDPFLNPKNKVEYWRKKDGKTGHVTQWNAKIQSGPDRGVHRWFDFSTKTGGETGVTRKYVGTKYRGVDAERPPEKRFRK